MVLERRGEIGHTPALLVQTGQRLLGRGTGFGAFEGLQVLAEAFLFEMGV